MSTTIDENSPLPNRPPATAHLPAALFSAAFMVCLVSGGCALLAGDKGDDNLNRDPNDPNEPSSAVQFVNTSPYDAAIVYYVGTADQRFESMLLRDQTRLRRAAVPAGERFSSDRVLCDDVESIKLTQVRFDLGGGESVTGATGMLLQGEDYLCEDTLRFTIDYRIQTRRLAIEFSVPADCNQNRTPDDDELAGGAAADCNQNGVPDECDIDSGTVADENKNGVPDPCEQE
jgi:hypothetical protein